MNNSHAALDQAIEWMACMRSGEVLPDEQKAFDSWFANPTNAHAWAQVQAHLGATFAPLGHAAPKQMRHVLQSPGLQRRQLLRGALVFGAVGIGATLLARHSSLLPTLGADLLTATAQRGDFALADGSSLVLDARSAVDINFSASQRTLVLRAGKLLIEASDDPRPLLVQTPHGVVRSAGARFMVALQGDATHVWGLRSSLCIAARDGVCAALESGAGARIDRQGITALAANRKGESSWPSGKLSVDDWSLGEVVAALQPYRRGVMRISPEASQLRVSGLFSLDQSERALASLAQILPVRIDHYLGWWTQIELRG